MRIFTFRTFSFFIFTFYFLSACAAPKVENGWIEAWRDDFNGSRVNEKYWSRIDKGAPDWRKNMSTRKDLVEVKGGNLILWGKKNDDLKADPRACLCGGIWTKDKRSFTGGKFEIRAKFEDQKGAWPAFWTVGKPKKGEAARGWPYEGEIDIVERLNADPFVYQTAHSAFHDVEHHGDPPPGGRGAFKPGEYTVFAVEIATNALIWSVNGKETFRYPRTDSAPTQWPYECPQHLKLDMQLGGSWVGPVDLSTLPVATYVDWVRWLVREDDPRLKGRAKKKRAGGGVRKAR